MKIDWAKYLGWISTVIAILTSVYLFGRQEKRHDLEVIRLETKIAVLEASDQAQEEIIKDLLENNEALTKNQTRLTTIVELLSRPDSD
jgi:PII-like signaling protein